MVRRLLGPDPATGQRRFTGQVFCYRDYRCADLAYAITGHAAQGGTVHTGIALVTGTEDRQWLYPAMTRGTDMNLAFVFTTPTQVADPRPGTEPAPELDRYDRLRLERQELTPARQTHGITPPPVPADWPSPPTPNYAAATPTRKSGRCAPPSSRR